ncbi:MAG TPA: lysophospholipase [Polyangiaceae bacterium]
MKDQSFLGVGGLNIHASSWHPEAQASRGVVVIAHGFNSHSGYYGWVASELVKSGLSVYALDHRGRGKSDGERFYVEKVSDYVDDLGTLIQKAKAREPGLPVFLLGHSAGGVISCTYALDHQRELRGLICESFAFQVYAPDFALAVLKGISHLAPHAHVLKLPNREFSRDQKVVDGMNADPLIAHEVQPTRTVAEMVRADERLKREFETITLPVLILHGSADKVTKPGGSQFFYEKAGSKDKTLKLYEDHAHDLLNDFDKEIVLADIQAWIDARIP